jgi:hypothetical protein
MMAMIKKVIAQLNMVILLTLHYLEVSLVVLVSRRRPHAKFDYLEHPALLTRHLVQRLRLVDVHHPHRGEVGLTAADGAEVGLGCMLNRYVRRLWLLALLPTHELLAGDQRDQQCQNSKQALLDMQWRDSQLGGTVAIHPEAPPTLVVILLVGIEVNALITQTIAACMPVFLRK